MPLTAAQLEHYSELGYAIGPPALEGADLQRMRDEMDNLIAGLPAGQRSENMPSIHYHSAYFRDLLLSEPLVTVARQLLGPDVAVFTSYAISKRPRDGLAVYWHQDAAYFPIEPMETFTLWLAVDDADAENGCMRVLPGSHKPRRILEHEIDHARQTTLPLRLDDVALEDAVDVPVKAGAYSVHDCYIVHGSNPNRSERRRCGITIKYIPSYVRIDRNYVSPSGFDWANIRIFHAAGKRGDLPYEN
jgi:ectoine hydroxylase-related dioxygenase (phytanoyl-CoA dioxygenase family)